MQNYFLPTPADLLFNVQVVTHVLLRTRRPHLDLLSVWTENGALNSTDLYVLF
jgi:hypothetical protein